MTSVLLVRLSAMGDLIQSLVAVESLRLARPDWRVTFVTQTQWDPLLDGVAGIAARIAFDRRAGLAGMRQLRAELRRRRFDVAVDLQGNWKSAFVTRLAPASERIGMASSWRQEPRSRWLLHRTVDCAAVPHPARAAWELVRSMAADAPFVWPGLVATETEISAEQQQLAAAGIDPDQPFTVIVVTDPSDPRALRPEFVRAAAAGAPQPLRLFGPAESEYAVNADVPQLRHAAGEVRRLVALGAAMARVGGRVLGPDQGATHVLLAAGAAGTVVYGAQDQRRTAPPAAELALHPEPPACQPCRRHRCDHPAGVVCMQFAPASARVVTAGLPPVGAVGDGPW